MEKIIGQTETNGRLCPFVEKPYNDCHFIKTKSQDIALTTFYCYKNFEICRIYRNCSNSSNDVNGGNGSKGKDHAQVFTERLSQINKKLIIGLVLFVFLTAMLVSNAFANAGIYGESVDFLDLLDQRTFSADYYAPSESEGGLTGYWHGFSISWDISYDQTAQLWSYEYTLSGSKAISHFILEVTNPSLANEIINPRIKMGSDDDEESSSHDGHGKYSSDNDGEDDDDSDNDWTPVSIKGPQFWGNEGNSTPGLPAGLLYGIKFDVGGNPITYAFETAKDPVLGNFYSKDGVDSIKQCKLRVSLDVYAYNNALGITGFNSSDKLDFIVRPDGGDYPPVVPEPVSSTLFFCGGAVLAVRRYMKKHKENSKMFSNLPNKNIKDKEGLK